MKLTFLLSARLMKFAILQKNDCICKLSQTNMKTGKITTLHYQN